MLVFFYGAAWILKHWIRNQAEEPDTTVSKLLLYSFVAGVLLFLVKKLLVYLLG